MNRKSGNSGYGWKCFVFFNFNRLKFLGFDAEAWRQWDNWRLRRVMVEALEVIQPRAIESAADCVSRWSYKQFDRLYSWNRAIVNLNISKLILPKTLLKQTKHKILSIDVWTEGLPLMECGRCGTFQAAIKLNFIKFTTRDHYSSQWPTSFSFCLRSSNNA